MKIKVLVASMALILSATANAAVYKCDLANGEVLYSNVVSKIKGSSCVIFSEDERKDKIQVVVESEKSGGSSISGTAVMDDKRNEILMKELNEEYLYLVKIEDKLSMSSSPADKASLSEEQKLHLRNVEALRKALGAKSSEVAVPSAVAKLLGEKPTQQIQAPSIVIPVSKPTEVKVPAPKTEIKVMPKAEVKVPAPKTEIKVMPKAEVKVPAPKTEIKVMPKAEVKVPAPKTETAVVQQPAPQPLVNMNDVPSDKALKELMNKHLGI